MLQVKIFGLFLVSIVLCLPAAQAQFRSNVTPPTYEELYDAPYEINKLFVHFQPICAELYATNVNFGFGVEAQYYLNDVLDIKGHARTAYAQATDFTRNVAVKNKESFQAYQPNAFSYFELGGNYHIKDFEEDTETKFILYSNRYKGVKWAAKVPDHIKAPTKVRKILGVRLGGMAYKSSFDMRRTLEEQDVILTAADSTILEPGSSLFGNVSAAGGYVGASYTWIKNVAIKFDKTYGVASSDLIFTGYFDVLVLPAMSVEDVILRNPDVKIYSADAVKTSILGFRLGMEGKFNRQFGWAYAAEMGMRPGVSSRALFANVRISFPVYSTTLSHEVEAFGK